MVDWALHSSVEIVRGQKDASLSYSLNSKITLWCHNGHVKVYFTTLRIYTYTLGEALHWAMSIISIVTTSVAAVALKIKPKLKKMSSIIATKSCDNKQLRPAVCVACNGYTSSHSSAAYETLFG